MWDKGEPLFFSQLLLQNWNNIHQLLNTKNYFWPKLTILGPKKSSTFCQGWEWMIPIRSDQYVFLMIVWVLRIEHRTSLDKKWPFLIKFIIGKMGMATKYSNTSNSDSNFLNPIHSAYSDCTSLMWEHRGVVLIDYGSALSEGPKNEVCCPAGGPAPPPRVTPNVWIWPNLGKCPPDRSRLQHSFRLDQVRMREGDPSASWTEFEIF